MVLLKKRVKSKFNDNSLYKAVENRTISVRAVRSGGERYYRDTAMGKATVKFVEVCHYFKC